MVFSDPQRRARQRHDVRPAPDQSPAQTPNARDLGLQQSLGNQAVQQRAAACPAFSSCPTGGACHPCPARVADERGAADAHEHAADQMAAHMAQVPVPGAAAPGAAPTEDQPLPGGLQTLAESQLGTDLSGVRLHTDATAAQSADALDARAYTTGHDIFFANGQYAPETAGGRQLLGHELTHVAQQAGQEQAPAVQRQPNTPTTTPTPTTLPATLPTLSPTSGVGLPSLLTIPPGFVSRMMAEQEAPVRRWLDVNTSRLRMLSMRALIRRVRRNVPEAASLPDVQLEGVLREWAMRNRFTIPPMSVIPDADESGIPPPPPRPGLADSSIISSIRSAVSTVIGGISIERPHGSVNVTVNGATIELRRGAFAAGGSVSWGGELGVTSSVGDVHFAGTLSADRWELKLSFPSETAAPDMSRVGEVFRAGTDAMREIVGATRSFRSLDDISAIKETISPHVQPVKDAMEAITGIAGTAGVTPRVSAGVSASGPGLGQPGAPARETGISISATLTVRF